MNDSDFPCGACKFLRNIYVNGCIFAPYFCHKYGDTHFSAVHKVFGASNVLKLLARIKVSDRLKAVVTIWYEAHARLQDPIYGIVSQIFALQQQVVNLQTQLASLKEFQAAHNFLNGSINTNPNEKFCEITNYMMPQFSTNNICNNASTIPYDENVFMENFFGNYGSSLNPKENALNACYEEASHFDYDLQPVAFD